MGYCTFDGEDNGRLIRSVSDVIVRSRHRSTATRSYQLGYFRSITASKLIIDIIKLWQQVLWGILAAKNTFLLPFLLRFLSSLFFGLFFVFFILVVPMRKCWIQHSCTSVRMKFFLACSAVTLKSCKRRCCQYFFPFSLYIINLFFVSFLGLYIYIHQYFYIIFGGVSCMYFIAVGFPQNYNIFWNNFSLIFTQKKVFKLMVSKI